MYRSMLAVLLALTGCLSAEGQELSGTVMDPTGAPIPAASVVVTPAGGGPATVVSTDPTGRFALESLARDRVVIVVSRPGFMEHRQEVTLAAGSATRIDVTLALSTFAEDLHVAASLSEIPSGSSRLGLSRRETPASVDIVTQEVIQARGADTASTALRYVTGVTSSLRPGASAVFSSRGFVENSLGVLFNGVRVQSATITMRNYDAFNFDRVEVLRGPASVLHGEGTAAGAINFVRREATPGRSRVEGLFETGEANRLRVGGAAAGSLGQSSSYSVSFARNQFDTHVDDNRHEYNHLAGALRTTTRRANFGVEGDWLVNTVDNAYWGTPLVNNKIDDRLYGLNFNRSENNTYADKVGWGRVTAAVPLSNRSVYNGQVYVYRADRDWRNSYGFEYLPDTNRVLRRAVENLGYDHRLWGTRHDVSFDFALGSRHGRAVAGGDVSFTKFSSPRSYGARVQVDATAPEALAFNAPDRLDDRRADLRQAAAYGELKLDVFERLALVAGGRAGALSNDVARPASGVALKQSFAPRDGRVGLVFAANRELSAYVQYATGSEPIEALLILGPSESGFALAHTRLWEGGIKASAAKGRIDLTAAVYHLGKRNLTTTDPEDSTRTIQIGAQSSRGVELAVTARPHPTLLVEANVAALDARYDRFREGRVSRDGNVPPNVPETVFNVGSTWRPIDRLETGFWLTFVGRRAADTTNTVFQPAFTLVDPFARVSLGPRADLTLRVRNATGQRYTEWATRAFGVTNVYFGEPRRTILSLRFRL
jgi:iron complex outermembrane receptor protein